MADFEKVIEAAVSEKQIPGCAVTATNRDGTFKYAKAFGSTSMNTGSARPFALDTVVWIASCTKLMTSICCMQLVEQGQLSLDEPVYKHIPELESFNVIKKIEANGTPIMEKHSKPITLRLLLTHSSGLGYEFWHPLLLGWLKHHGKTPSAAGKIFERFSAPMIFEPGESWMYGSGIDYAGILVERITGQTLQEYMTTNLWEPLGIKDMTFKLSSRPDMAARLADMSTREESGELRWNDERQMYMDDEGKEAVDDFGGHGIFTTAEEYLKILRAVLITDEDEKILKKGTIEEFFSPQLGEGAKAKMNEMLQDEALNNIMGGTSKSITKNWGLGGLLIEGDAPHGQTAGTMIWGGLPNLTWFVDRKTGLCGLYTSQVVPPGDAKSVQITKTFEEGMYKLYKSQSA